MKKQRDIDYIIKTLEARVPDVIVVQMNKVHPADDDNLWWFRVPNERRDIQIESPTGNCPFIVECSDDKSSSDARTGHTTGEVVLMVENYLAGLR